MSQADIACYASKNSGRGVVTVYEPQQERIHSTRSMMSLDEQWHMIKDNHLLMIARSVASPRIPESSSFWLISLRLWTSQEVLEEHAFRAGLAEPELLHAWTDVSSANFPYLCRTGGGQRNGRRAAALRSGFSQRHAGG